MSATKTAPETARSRDVKNRWLLSLPALAIIFVAALGPLLVMVLYSFLEKGDYGDVKFGTFSLGPGEWRYRSLSATGQGLR